MEKKDDKKNSVAFKATTSKSKANKSCVGCVAPYWGFAV